MPATGSEFPREKEHPTHPRRGLLLVLSIGVLTFLPALRSPFLLDDYLHVAMVDGTFPVARGPFDLYDFVSDVDRAVLLERGILPWWTHPQLTIRFFRPLSSALLWTSHRLLGAHSLLLHLHSLLWWGAAVVAAFALYRRAFSPRVALLAAAIFALAPCHAIPLAWLANFESLVSVTLGALGLAAYVRFRDDGRARTGLVATMCFALAMAAGEYALCFAGYVVAFELLRGRERWTRRALGLLSFALPTAGYLLARAVGHYGTVGSGFYTDPLGDPLGFVRTAPWRITALLADGWLTSDADTWGPDAPRWAMVLIVVALVALLIVPVRRVLSALPEAQRRAASWLLLGSPLSLLPVLAVAPSPRVLGISAIGLSSTVALVLDHAWFSGQNVADRAAPDSNAPSAAVTRSGAAQLTSLVALMLGFLHLVHGPVTSWLLSQQMRQSAIEFAEHADWLRARLPDPGSADVVVVRGWGGMFFGPFALDAHARPPKRWRILSQTGHVLVLRKDARTLELVAPEDRSLTSTGPGNLFRSHLAPLRVGDEIAVPGMRATVLETGPDGPRRVRYVFDRELEAKEVTWIAEGFAGFRDATPPPIGLGVPIEP